MVRVAGILLAAGGGSRLGRPKALVEIGGQTLAERGVTMLRAGGADPVLLVTGAAPVTVPGASTIRNPLWRTGMGSSLAAALGSLAPLTRSTGVDGANDPGGRGRRAVTAAVIALADQPGIGPEAVRRLIAAHQAGASLAIAAYDQAPLNPVLIAREHWTAVAETVNGRDTGARPYLRAHWELVTLVDCSGTGDPSDIDTAEDLTRVRAIIRASSQI
jgi:CTP:molybdopterin cytidylyltransferase MocA